MAFEVPFLLGTHRIRAAALAISEMSDFRVQISDYKILKIKHFYLFKMQVT